ncbi:MAG: hypothetical protein ACRENG_10575 [bacterium]
MVRIRVFRNTQANVSITEKTPFVRHKSKWRFYFIAEALFPGLSSAGNKKTSWLLSEKTFVIF